MILQSWFWLTSVPVKVNDETLREPNENLVELSLYLQFHHAHEFQELLQVGDFRFQDMFLEQRSRYQRDMLRIKIMMLIRHGCDGLISWRLDRLVHASRCFSYCTSLFLRSRSIRRNGASCGCIREGKPIVLSVPLQPWLGKPLCQETTAV